MEVCLLTTIFLSLAGHSYNHAISDSIKYLFGRISNQPPVVLERLIRVRGCYIGSVASGLWLMGKCASGSIEKLRLSLKRSEQIGSDCQHCECYYECLLNILINYLLILLSFLLSLRACVNQNSMSVSLSPLATKPLRRLILVCKFNYFICSKFLYKWALSTLLILSKISRK